MHAQRDANKCGEGDCNAVGRIAAREMWSKLISPRVLKKNLGAALLIAQGCGLLQYGATAQTALPRYGTATAEIKLGGF
jgi:hypothetical protein